MRESELPSQAACMKVFLYSHRFVERSINTFR